MLGSSYFSYFSYKTELLFCMGHATVGSLLGKLGCRNLELGGWSSPSCSLLLWLAEDEIKWTCGQVRTVRVWATSLFFKHCLLFSNCLLTCHSLILECFYRCNSLNMYLYYSFHGQICRNRKGVFSLCAIVNCCFIVKLIRQLLLICLNQSLLG